MIADHYFPAIRHLAEYELWCNARTFDAAAALDESALHQHFPFGLGTIHKTLFHIASVFRTWSGCISPKIIKPSPLSYDPHASLDSITRLNTELSIAFLDAIDRSHAAGVLHLDRRIEQVFHLITHGTHHRTQFVTMLRLLGKDPPFEAGDFGGWSNAPPAQGAS
jgi:uncharacterized damage-inducible protein DinB